MSQETSEQSRGFAIIKGKWDPANVGYEAGTAGVHFPEAAAQPDQIQPSPQEFSRKAQVAAPAAPVERAQAVIPTAPASEPLRPILRDRPTVDPDAVFTNLTEAADFVEHGEGLSLHHDFIGARYIERIARAIHKSEKREAASYGVGKFHGAEVVIYGKNWGFLGGSTGVVAGEKFVEAMDLAKRRNIPFVGIYASGGMRQDEDFAALEQLGRMIYAADEFARDSRELNISVLAHRTYGGVSVVASIADVIVGMTGSDFGFAGPDVIEGYTGRKVPAGEQSVERNYEQRNVHFLVNDEAELHEWLSRVLHHTRHSKHTKLTPEAVAALAPITGIEDHDRFPFDQLGYSTLFTPVKEAEGGAEETQRSSRVVFEDLYQRYKGHEKNPSRPDTEYLLRQVFTDVVPFYGRVSDGKMLQYPPIIAALGRIGEQSYLIVGDQPSYQRVAGQTYKIPASPKPEDFTYLMEMLAIGRKLGIPAVLFTDTFGANPTIESESRGQSGAIARAIRAGTRYEPPLLSINIGILGSGGGLATTPRGEKRAMLENAFGFVAEAKSSTAIRLKRVPTDEEVAALLPAMRATAAEMQADGFIDDVIPEAGGAWENPVGAAEKIREYIARSTIETQEQSWRFRRAMRKKIIRNRPGLPLKRG